MEANMSPAQVPGPGQGYRLRDRTNPIATTLERSRLLDAEELSALRQIPYKKVTFEAAQLVQDALDRAGQILLVLDGLAAVQTDFSDGSRQITDTLAPGDLYGLGGLLGLDPDHAVASITRLSIAVIDPASLAPLLAARPRLYAALLWASQRRERILREHVRIVGRRNARKRLAHLLCCLHARHLERDPTAETYTLAVTHSVLADAIGMTTVHVGRVLRGLTRERLIRNGRCGVAVINAQRLRSVAEFHGIH